MRHFRFWASCLLLLISALIYWGTIPQTEHRAEYPSSVISQTWPEVVEFAREHLPLEGVLTQKSDGYVYLKVDDRYIYTLFPMLGLKEEGFREPSYFRSTGSPGAHITVFYVDEHVTPREIGQTFHFDLKRVTIIHTSNASYAVLQVTSPELERLRKEYGLTPKLHGHDYHISIAKKFKR